MMYFVEFLKQTKGVVMDNGKTNILEPSKEDLINEGIKLLEQVVCHFGGIDANLCQEISTVVNSLVSVAKLIY